MESDKAMKTALANMSSELAKNKTVITDIQSDNKIILELVNTIYQRVEDMSKKFDEMLNTGLKKPKTAPAKKADAKSSETTDDDIPKKKKPVKKDTESNDADEKSTESGGKLIKNIMTYFKVRYSDDQTFFDNILEEKQAESLFAEHSEELKNKKGDAKIKTQASIIYKNLNKAQKKKVREKMMDENDAAGVNNDDDIMAEQSE